MTTYFGFGLADNMFPEAAMIRRLAITPERAKELLETTSGLQVCLNPSHKETIRVMRERFGIHVGIPQIAPVVSLKTGDSLIVMSVSGLPRLEGRHEYTAEEMQAAEFRFGLYSVSTET